MMTSLSFSTTTTMLLSFFLVLLGTVEVVSSSSATTTSSKQQPLVQKKNDIVDMIHHERNLQRGIDFIRPGIDLCNNNPDKDGIEILGDCDNSKFPNCSGNEFICYNRKPSRDHFFEDGSHQPKYFIQYDRVLCYPQNFGACSSCTPGRFCVSEQRCILDEVDYQCEQWY